MKPLVIILLSLLLTGKYQAEKWDLVDLIDSLGYHDFGGLLQSSGFYYQLGDDKAGPFTVYVPTNDAFDKLPQDVVDRLNNDDNHNLLMDLVSYHITFGNLSFYKWTNEMRCPTALEGTDLRLNLYKNRSGEVSEFTASGSTVLKADLVATNGMVQVIDTVMYNIPTFSLPEYIQENINLSKLAMLMQTSNYFQQLKMQNLTFFAPTDEAFSNKSGLFSDLLSNDTATSEMFADHLVNGTLYTHGLKWFSGTSVKTNGGKYLNVMSGPSGVPLTVNGANLKKKDISVYNGVVHLVDSLLFPTANYG